MPPAAIGSWGSRFRWRGYQVSLAVPGRHNVLNAVAALEACALAGVEPAMAAAAMADFPGARRRIEMVGTTASGARVYDDCANHPNTVRTSLAALRTVESGRIVAVYEPLLYTRTRTMADDVGAALAVADDIVVLDVFPGSEEFVVPRVSGALVADAVRASARDRPVMFAKTISVARHHLVTSLEEGNACILMGWGPGPSLLARDLVSLS
jgi:UDP-N-acetylmuramate--alanine ligase